MVGTLPVRALARPGGSAYPTQTHNRLLAARCARGLPENLSPFETEGAGNAGCPMHPQPRARWVVLVCARVFTAEAPETSGIPHAMVLRLIRDLPGDEFLLPPSLRGLNGFTCPVGSPK